ncbi:DUF4038 domain-containing protein [uncultured Arcticibacterium sp.]|uniref:apiosidase-like domain-containing protein n=1 Tax=uncultured Arcticibacterium sp. TaxID=2173042 RepID=UPI0030F6F042
MKNLIVFFLLFQSFYASGQSSIQQWEVKDVAFEIDFPKGSNPFDLNIEAYVAGNTKSQTLPLFYNGGNEWILRFSSAETGIYSYQVLGDWSVKNDAKGTIGVTENKKDDRHGAIVLNSSNKKRFFYEDGTHYFNLAFECDWLFALDYNQKELKKTEQLLNTIKENGLNQVVMNVYAHDVVWEKDVLLQKHPEHEYGGKMDMFPFLGNNEEPDFEKLNVEFFKHLDRVIASLHDKEITSHLMIYVWNKAVNWPDMNTDADNRYFDYVVKRYQAYPNMVWDISKEALFYGRASEEYILERIERLRKIDKYDRILSVHDYGFCSRNPDKVDFISSQNWTGTLYNSMLNMNERFSNKPVFNIEHGGYEESPYVVFTGAYISPEVCLRRNYMCLFAGVYSTYYWQGTSWNVVIHNPFEQPSAFIKPKFDYYKNLNSFFEKYDFKDFSPQPKANSSGYCLKSHDGKTFLYYFPKENFHIKLWPVLKHVEGTFTYQFFNTITGEYSDEHTYNKKQGDGIKSPWYEEDDSILILKIK